MRLWLQLCFSLVCFAGLSSTAGARTVASTFAELGDSQNWPLIAVALGALSAISLVLLLLSRLQLSKMKRRLGAIEHELTHQHKTTTILKDAHEELETRVRDRTADLEMSYQKLNDVRDSLKAANDRLESLGRVDELTGVANERQLRDSLETEIKRTVRSRQPVSLIVTELDFFELYRRKYGRDRADDAMRKVAAQVEKIFRRAPDIVARHDDHSFAVILPETELRDAMRFAERLRESVSQLCIPFPESEIADRITVSVGLATMQPNRLYSPEELLSGACSALTAAQQSGRNTVEFGSVQDKDELEATQA